MTQPDTATDVHDGYRHCAWCLRERRVGRDGRIITHRRYQPETRSMVVCPGSGSEIGAVPPPLWQPAR